MNKTDKIYSFNKKTIIALILIICIQVLYLFIVFSIYKVGYHSDEIWNYGFSNSHDFKDIELGVSGNGILNNWNDSEIMKQYITVEKDHRFDYSSVYQNCVKDLNPPLQFFLLHTICSFFPGVFSKYFCFIINIISFVICQIYLFKLLRNMTGNDVAGVAAVIMYGFGVGALDITFFLRIYALGVAFAIIFAYYSFEVYRQRKEAKIKISLLIKIFISCFLGAFTIHLFLVVAFAITFCYSIYYLFSKNIKRFFIYGLTCSASVGFSILVFPSTIPHLFSPKESTGYGAIAYPFDMQFRFYWHFITKDLFGINVDYFPDPSFKIFCVCALFVLAVITPILLVFRKEKWFQKAYSFLKNDFKNTLAKLKNFQFGIIAHGVTVVFLIVIASLKSSVYFMGWYSNRYIFLVYPIMISFAVCCGYYIVCFFVRKPSISVIIALIISCVFAELTHFYSIYEYFFEENRSGITFSDFENDSNSIIILSQSWLVVCLCPYLYDTNSFYPEKYNDYVDDSIFDNINKNAPMYLAIDQSKIMDEDEINEIKSSEIQNDEFQSINDMDFHVEQFEEKEFLDYYNSLDCVESIDFVGTDGFMYRDFNIYKINFAN